MTDFASGFMIGGCLGLVLGCLIGYFLGSYLAIAKEDTLILEDFKEDINEERGYLETLSKKLEEDI